MGLDLELQSSEAPVGSFSLDVLAHDLGSNRPVIIENQWKPPITTTWGSCLPTWQVTTLMRPVWLTQDFRDEHRQALDWLNQRTDEDTAFYGVVVEAWRIDGSRPAPHFRVVAAPNDWQKRMVSVAKTGRAGGLSEKQQRYHEFFQNLIDKMLEEHQFTVSPKARNHQYQPWCNFGSGFTGVGYNPSFDHNRNTAKVELYISRNDPNWNNQLFDRLENHRKNIEAELPGTWEWRRLNDRKVCRISIISQDVNIDDDNESREWMVDKLLAFKRVFGPHLAESVK